MAIPILVYILLKKLEESGLKKIIFGEILIMETEKEEQLRWIEAWKRAEVALEEIHRKELREFNYEERREAVLGMLELGALFRRPRNTSGMIEMQKILRKMHP